MPLTQPVSELAHFDVVLAQRVAHLARRDLEQPRRLGLHPAAALHCPNQALALASGFVVAGGWRAAQGGGQVRVLFVIHLVGVVEVIVTHRGGGRHGGRGRRVRHHWPRAARGDFADRDLAQPHWAHRVFALHVMQHLR